MKKLIFAFLTGLVMVGCASSKKAAEPQILDAQKPIIWKQELYPKLIVGDPILFYNSSEIILDGDFFNQTYTLQDGNIYRLDSILKVIKIVSMLTPGVLVSMKKVTNGQIEGMNISFSQNDATYQLIFLLKSDKTFTLNANAILFYKEKEYKVQAKFKGGECLLLVNYFEKTEIIPVNESAEGRSVSGTKIIK